MSTTQPSRPAPPGDALAARIASADRAALRAARTPVKRAVDSGDPQTVLLAHGALERATAQVRREFQADLDAAIRARRTQGASWADVARELGVSVTRVQQLRAARKLD